MNPIDSELQGLERLYDALECRLNQQYRNLETDRPADPDRERLMTDLVQRAEEASRRFVHLARDWQSSKPSNRNRSEVASRASDLSERARQLLQLIERNIAGFGTLQRTARESLQELKLGEQFLQSVRGYRENRPKFIDARQ
ncbi:MAG: hypothetical protein LAP85_03585 [Acidobacteriia bacterium]|nr:hypothetical protein [Terriglobia bacterium]